MSVPGHTTEDRLARGSALDGDAVRRLGIPKGLDPSSHDNDPISHYGIKQDFDFTVGKCFMSDENIARWIPTRHETLSDSDVTVCLSYDSV